MQYITLRRRYSGSSHSSMYQDYLFDQVVFLPPLIPASVKELGNGQVLLTATVSDIHVERDKGYPVSMKLDYVNGKILGFSGAYPSSLEMGEGNMLRDYLETKLYNGFYDLVKSGVLSWVCETLKTSGFIMDGIHYGTEVQKEAIGNALEEDSGKPGSVRFDLLLDKESDGSLYVQALVGNTRLYHVKDPYQFFVACRDHLNVPYGKQFSWNHNTHDLSEQDREKLDLFRTVLQMMPRFTRIPSSGHVPMTENTASRLLATYIDRKYPLNLGGRGYDEVVRENVRLEGRIAKGDLDSLSFSVLSPGLPLYFSGDNLLVFLRDRSVLVSHSPFAGWFSRLGLSKALGETFTITKDDIPSFALHMVPALEHAMTLEGKDVLPEGLTVEKGEFRFFLERDFMPRRNYWDEDEDRDDAISIKPTVQYHGKRFSFLLEGKEADPFRDLLAEAKVRFYLKSLKGSVIMDNNVLLMPIGTEEGLFEISTTLMEKLSSYGEVVLSDNLKDLTRVEKSAVSVNVSVEGDLLGLTFHVDEEFLSQVPDILKAYKEQKRYYRIPSSGFFLDLEDDAMKEVAALVSQLGLDEKDIGKKTISMPSSRAMFLDGELKGFRQIGYQRSDTFKRIVMAMRGFEDSGYEVPSAVTAKLRHYQESAFRWLRSLSGQNLSGILADDMGLGKTLETLTLFASWKEEKGTMSALVIAPASLLYNWKDEGAKFVPSLSLVPIVGTASQKEALMESPADIYVTSYDQVRRSTGLFAGKQFDFIVLDEAQNIKNGLTKAARSVKTLVSRHRLALTGTPVQNRLSDLWSIFDFLMPGYLFSQEEFRKRYEGPISRGDKGQLGNLQKMVLPFVLRRMKGEVLGELPERDVAVRKVEMEDEQQNLYQANLVASKNEFRRLLAKKGLKQSKIEVLALLTKLREICCDPLLVYQDYKGSSAKRDQCMDLVEEAVEGGHSVLVFSQFAKMLDLLEADVKDASIPYYRLDGSTDKESRHTMTTSFQEDEVKVFLISLKAGGLGLNLTKADTVILYDPWWNVAAEEQAMDRVYRIGQKRSVQVYRLIAGSSIEEKILGMQEKKRQLTQGVIGEGADILSGLSEEEWLSLFE